MNIDKMRQRIVNDWEDTEVLPIALRIFERLLQEYDDLQGIPLNISAYNPNQRETEHVIKVFNYFCHPKIKVLRPYYELYSGQIHEVTADELYEAEKDGYLPHPITGEPIYDYKSQVHVSFVMNEDFFNQELEVF